MAKTGAHPDGVHTQQQSLETPLCAAVGQGHINIVRLLLDFQANVEMPTIGQLPLDLVDKHKRSEAANIRVLLENAHRKRERARFIDCAIGLRAQQWPVLLVLAVADCLAVQPHLAPNQAAQWAIAKLVKEF